MCLFMFLTKKLPLKKYVAEFAFIIKMFLVAQE